METKKVREGVRWRDGPPEAGPSVSGRRRNTDDTRLRRVVPPKQFYANPDDGYSEAMTPIFRSRFFLILVISGSCLLGARGQESGDQRWPDAAEVNRMFGAGSETPVQRHVKAAFAAMKSDDNRRAVQEWNEVLRLHPEYSGAYFYRARAYENLNLREKSIADLTDFPRTRFEVGRGICHARHPSGRTGEV